jgi:hypothetical protein
LGTDRKQSIRLRLSTHGALIALVVVCALPRIFGQQAVSGGDLDKPFKLEANILLDASGKRASGSLEFTRAEGDAKTIEFVKAGVVKIADGGLLKFLSGLGAHEVIICVSQDDKDLTGSVTGGLLSESKARSAEAAVRAMLKMSEVRSKGPNLLQKDLDEITLLQNMTVGRQGSSVIINLKMPKVDFWRIAGAK